MCSPQSLRETPLNPLSDLTREGPLFRQGDVFADRQVITLVGRGGMTEVYAVREPLTQRFEVLKVLLPARSSDAATRERFTHEYVITRNLEHPNILVPHELGESEGLLWLSYSRVAQHSAAALKPKPGNIPDLALLEKILRDVASALDYAHKSDIIHLDVKPANILLVAAPSECALGEKTPATGTNQTFLSDFGSAENSEDGKEHANRLASLPYAAPELLTARRGDYGEVGPATDQYALAATAMELITGKPPFPKGTAWAIAGAHLRLYPPSARSRAGWLPPAVDSVLEKALSKKPEQRYDSCSHFIHILLRVLSYRDH